MYRKQNQFFIYILALSFGWMGCQKKIEAPVVDCQNGGTLQEGSSYCDCPEGYMYPDCKYEIRETFVGKFTVTFSDEGQNILNNPYTFTITKKTSDIWSVFISGDKPPFNSQFEGYTHSVSWGENPYVSLGSSSVAGGIFLNTEIKDVYIADFEILTPYEEYDGTMIKIP